MCCSAADEGCTARSIRAEQRDAALRKPLTLLCESEVGETIVSYIFVRYFGSLYKRVDFRRSALRLKSAFAIDIIANNSIDQKVADLSSSQYYSLFENAMYRFVFPPQGV